MSAPTVGVNGYVGTTNSTSLTTTPGVTTQATGSSFLVFVISLNSSAVTVTDSFSNTPYTAIVPTSGTNPVHETNDGGYLWCFLCTNAAGGAAHTWTAAASSGSTYVNAIEIIGGALLSLVDVSKGLYTATAPHSIPITTTLANDLVVAGMYSGAGSSFTFAPGAGFTSIQQNHVGTSYQGTAYSPAASIGSYDPAWTGGSGEGFVGITVALSGNTIVNVAWII